MQIRSMTHIEALQLATLRELSKSHVPNPRRILFNWGLSEHAIFVHCSNLCLSAVSRDDELLGGVFARRSMRKIILGPVFIREEYRDLGVAHRLCEKMINSHKANIVLATRTTSGSIVKFCIKNGAELWKPMFFLFKNIDLRSANSPAGFHRYRLTMEELDPADPPTQFTTLLTDLDLLSELQSCRSSGQTTLLAFYRATRLIAFALVRLSQHSRDRVMLLHRFGFTPKDCSGAALERIFEMLEAAAMNANCRFLCLWVDTMQSAIAQVLIRRKYKIDDFQLGIGFPCENTRRKSGAYTVTNDFR